jgi:hypothetical protein
MFLSIPSQLQKLQTLLLLLPLQGLLWFPSWLPHLMLHFFMVRSWQTLCKVKRVKIIVQYVFHYISKTKLSFGVLPADVEWGRRAGWECSAANRLLIQ